MSVFTQSLNKLFTVNMCTAVDLTLPGHEHD